MGGQSNIERDTLLLHAYAEDVYLRYAIATVKDRALPQVEDGQKPVQRRILFTMRNLGLLGTTKPVKSARIVGEVLGKLHPHGDSTVYEAMVRMAQDFSLRYPLVTGQGNYGSRDGDPAAAMRYTEARLAPIAELLLAELGQGTVDFAPNYDNTEQEPTRLPARLPFTLLNGAMGIAVGMATNIPPHNLREVAAAAIALIENPKLGTRELLEHIPGPDFPDGAQLISSRAEILSAYETGRGILRARAVWKREDLARGQYQLVVTQMPYQVSAKKIQEQLETLTNPQPSAGKKAITPQQANLKAVALGLVEKVVDESNKDEPVRLVVVPRTSRVSPDEVMNFLFANTSLEESVGVNMTMVGLDGKPQTKGLAQMLAEWVAFRLTTVRRRTQWGLDQTNRRIHVLEGRMVVYLNLDRVIKVIREADDPKAELMARFKLSEAQAEDILEMRLRQLNKLEGTRIERELDELRKEAARLTTLLRSEAAMKKLIVHEIAADAEKFGDERRTVLKEEVRISTASAAVRTVPDEEATVILSKSLWVRSRPGHEVDPSTIAYKPGDEAFAVLKTRTVWPVLVLDSRGRAYSVQAADIPGGRGDGVPLTTLIELQDGARVMHVLSGNPSSRWLFAGQNGYGFVATLENLVARPRAGKAFLTLEEGELPLAPVPVPEGLDGFIAAASTEGRLLAFPASEVKALEKGKGVMLMALPEGASLSVLRHLDRPALEGTMQAGNRQQALALRGADFDKYLLHRARRGCQLPKKGILLP